MIVCLDLLTGRSIQVYGAREPAPGRVTASYKIDSGAWVDVDYGNGTYNPLDTNWRFNQLLYKSESLNEGKHRLTVKIKEVVESQVSMLSQLLCHSSSVLCSNTIWTTLLLTPLQARDCSLGRAHLLEQLPEASLGESSPSL